MFEADEKTGIAGNDAYETEESQNKDIREDGNFALLLIFLAFVLCVVSLYDVL